MSTQTAPQFALGFALMVPNRIPTPVDFLPADGRWLAKTEYPELFDLMGFYYGREFTLEQYLRDQDGFWFRLPSLPATEGFRVIMRVR